MRRLISLAVGILAVLGGLIDLEQVSAQSPSGEVTLKSPVIGARIDDPGPEPIELDLEVHNSGSKPIEAEFRLLSDTHGWEVGVFHKFKDVWVNQVRVPAEDKVLDLAFRLDVPAGTDKGTYTFRIGLFDSSGLLLDELEYSITIGNTLAEETAETVVEEEEPEVTEIVTLSTRFRSLTGSVDDSITFRVDLKNNDRKEREFALAASVAPGWRVVFKPAFQNTQIASVNVPKFQNRGLDVTLTPPPASISGKHTVVVSTVTEDGNRSELSVQIELRGKPDLELTTVTGRLSIRSTAGEATDIKLVALNNGSDVMENIHMISNAPSEWNVKFAYDTIERLEPGEVVEIALSVTPPGRTIPGDYNVSFIASSLQGRDEADFRITVIRSSVFGFVGIAIVVLVALGIAGLFVRLGRR